MSLPSPSISLRSMPLFGQCAVTEAVKELANAGIEQRGAVYTRREVVDFILDLSGYTVNRPLHTLRLLEPSFGAGDFLFPAIDRLLTSWRAGGEPDPLNSLAPAIKAVELHRNSFEATHLAVARHLVNAGIEKTAAESLTAKWLSFGDYLLTDIHGPFDVIVGNPPYVRQEMIANVLMEEYRTRYSTIYDRSDLYVPFFERSLSLLSETGQLGFICSDRWMKNKYGGPLRKFISRDFHLKFFVDMVDTPAFLSDVVAYPAITVFTRKKSTSTLVARRPHIEQENLAALAAALTGVAPNSAVVDISEVKTAPQDGSPWILDSSQELDLVRRLETRFPTLEQAGCKVGIGVATGADKAFIGKFDALDVERSRKLPLVMTKDIEKGKVSWRGLGVINPFDDDGRLVDLTHFPKLSAYLEARRDQIAGRHVAQKIPNNWYRTIDRIYPEIAAKPKLLIPDIKGAANIVFENQGLYPHHNLYFITSDHWNLQALQAVLLSGIAHLFVATYSTKMRGGYLRFQAQYLRRIRVPKWTDIPDQLKADLTHAGQKGDVHEANRAVFALYGLSGNERVIIERVGA